MRTMKSNKNDCLEIRKIGQISETIDYEGFSLK